MTAKSYSVVLFDQAAEELAPIVPLWLRRAEKRAHIYARKIDPNGPYFCMTLGDTTPDGKELEFELQIPHAFIKAVFYASDFKHLGFVDAPNSGR